MDLKQLEYFIAVVEQGSILQAAKHLHLSQPPLSVSMRLLEQELQVELFIRGNRKIQLTDAGKQLYLRSTDLLHLFYNTRQELQEFAKGVIGTLRLGTVSSSSSSLLDQRLIGFHQQYPSINFELREGNTFEQMEKLKSGLIEIAIVRTPFQEPNVHQLILDQDVLAAVVDQDCDDLPESPIPLHSLKGHPLIYYRRFEAILNQEMEKEGVNPSLLCLNDDARTSMQWARAKMGIAIVPLSTALSFSWKELHVKPIDCPALATSTVAIWQKNRTLSYAAQHFIDYLHQN